MAPLIAVSAATLIFGLPQLPVRLRHLGQAVVGSAVGLYLTPAAMERIGQDAVPILLGAGMITIAACLIGLAQMRFAQVLHLDVPMVASYQIVRIVLSLLFVGLFFKLYRWVGQRSKARKKGNR